MGTYLYPQKALGMIQNAKILIFLQLLIFIFTHCKKRTLGVRPAGAKVVVAGQVICVFVDRAEQAPQAVSQTHCQVIAPAKYFIDIQLKRRLSADNRKNSCTFATMNNDCIPIKRILACYFSPTGATRRVTHTLAETLSLHLEIPVQYHPYTTPAHRATAPVITEEDLLIWATPTYAGRIPNKTLSHVAEILRNINGTRCIAVATFGNRHYDNALAELVSLMRQGGGLPLAAAAIVTRHSFSKTLAAGRPNSNDNAQIEQFAHQVALKIKTADSQPVTVPGEPLPQHYYTPLQQDGEAANILKVRPQCDASLCIHCGKCVDVCPMGSITKVEGIPHFNGTCIKCQACVAYCPEQAIQFTDPSLLSHIAMIEQNFAEPKEPQFFL